jgi:hypothetical protein
MAQFDYSIFKPLQHAQIYVRDSIRCHKTAFTCFSFSAAAHEIQQEFVVATGQSDWIRRDTFVGDPQLVAGSEK